jgi:hypothetical protein
MPEAWTMSMKKWEEGILDSGARVVCHGGGGVYFSHFFPGE